MIAVIQRVSGASVHIGDRVSGAIGQGILILLGITHTDVQEDIDWLVKKIHQLRIFTDDEGKMNLSVQDIQGEALVVSQFTLHASTKKGNRPSYVEAAPPELALPLYEQFLKDLEAVMPTRVQTGEFGAMMHVALVNEGPVTLLIDTKNRV